MLIYSCPAFPSFCVVEPDYEVYRKVRIFGVRGEPVNKLQRTKLNVLRCNKL